MGKNLLHRFIASLLILTLGYVQVVLVHHERHSISEYSQESFSQAHSDSPNCDICDYHSTKRHLDAIVVSKTALLIFAVEGKSAPIKKEALLLSSFENQLSNRGPPRV